MKNIKFNNFTNGIIKLVNYYNKGSEINAIIIVGSNYNKQNFNEINKNHSDVDIIVLTSHESYKVFIEYEKIPLDISYVNYYNISQILISALNKNQFASKIISSLNSNYTLIKGGESSQIFIDIIKGLYSVFSRTSLPDYAINHMYIHNINSCISDLNKSNNFQIFFSTHSLYSQIFEFISYLVYPFYINGSYRGDVFNRFLGKSIYDDIYFDKYNFPIIEYSVIKKIKDRFIPVLKSNYKAILCDKDIFDKLRLLKKDTKYHFGCDNLDNENLVVFIEKKGLKELKEIKNCKVLLLTNIVPCFSKQQLIFFLNFLCFLSKKHLKSEYRQRYNIFCSITCRFYNEELPITSLKAVLLKKIITELNDEKEKLDLYSLNSFISSKNFLLNYEESIIINDKINNMLENILFFIKNSYSSEEKNIKLNHVFFGIMKALRINISQLEFKN